MSSNDQTACLDERFRLLRATLRCPGVTAGALLPGGERWHAVDGAADLAGETAMSAATPLRIGSVTKTFTAAAIVVLAERGALNLDDPAVAHLPELTRLRTEGHPLEALTIKRLLLHRSGLVGEPPTRDWLKAPFPSIEEILRHIDLARLAIVPGSAFKYSNLGFALLGEIVARASEQPYERFVQQTLLAPAEMPDTTFDTPANAARGYGHAPDGGFAEQAAMEFGGERAGGGMWSTARDLLRWAQVAMGDVPAALSSQSAELLRCPQNADDAAPEPQRALGWGLIRDGGRLLHEHGGGVTGFTCHLAFEASTGAAAVVLTNGHAHPEPACLGLLGIERPAPASQPPATPSSPDPAGDYAGPLDLTARIQRREDGTLWLTGELLGEPAGACLQPRGEDRYEVRAGRFIGDTLVLQRAADGNLAAFTVAGFRFARDC